MTLLKPPLGPPSSDCMFPSNSEAGRLARSLDWAATPLGPTEHWPPSLKTATNLVLAAGFPTILLWGPALVQIYNDSYRDVMGAKHPTGMGQPTRDCWPEVWHINQPILARVLQGETLTFTDRLFPITRHGHLEQAYFTLCYSPVRDEAGTVAGALVTVFETTERLKAEQKLRESQAELASSNAALEVFAHTAAHDLQEPLRTIRSYLQLLGREFKAESSGDGLTFINLIADAAQRMQDLIHALLLYADASSAPIAFRAVDVKEIIRSAEANLRATLDETGATLTYDEVPNVLGDPTQLVQLFENLFSNALKYRSPEAPRIHVSAVVGTQEAVVAVSDEGMGISREYHEKIFVSFQRLHGREYPGTGLGLASCQRILERHGGRIWVDSEIGKGSTFYFTLKLAEVAPARIHHKCEDELN